MAEVIYYYDSHGYCGWWNCPELIDGNELTYGYISTTGAYVDLDSTTCVGTDLGTITKVEVNALAQGDGGDRLRFYTALGSEGFVTPLSIKAWTPFVDVTSWYGWNWATIASHIMKLAYVSQAKANQMNVYKVQLRVTYEPSGTPVTIDAPLVAVDSEAKIGILSLGLGLLPPPVGVSSEGKAPSLVRDRIFNSPLVAVNSEALAPSWILEALVQPPVVVVGSEALIPALLRDSIMQSPVVGADGAALIPTIVRGLTLDSPLVAIDSDVLFPSLSIGTILIIPLVALNSEAKIPTLSLGLMLVSPLVAVDVDTLIPIIFTGLVETGMEVQIID